MRAAQIGRSLWRNRSNKAYWARLARYYLLRKGFYRIIPNNATDVMDADWDIMILLDACRYDTFSECHPEKWPEARCVSSRASSTYGFYEKNFTDSPYPDTVAVTANPRTVQLRGDVFHHLEPVYRHYWDDDYGTVWPDRMAKSTIEIAQRFPNKRILSHWIQPHYPFIGSDTLNGYQFDERGVWEDLKEGKIDVEAVYQAYKDTLELTFPHVQRVLNKLEGKIVVTSDHGNAFGESPWWFPFPLYGHPRGIRHSSIVDVPWMTSIKGERREIHTADVTQVTANSALDSRLEALGYAE